MRKSVYFLTDCEITGLNPDKHMILTMYGAILDEEFSIQEEINLQIKPDTTDDYAFSLKAMEANKINLIEHHKIALPMSEAKTKLLNFIERNITLNKNKKPNTLIPIGHNVNFEIEFIKKLTGFEAWERFFHHHVIDTGTIILFLEASGILAKGGRTALGSLAERFGCEFPKDTQHIAKGDALVTLNVLKEMMNVVKVN